MPPYEKKIPKNIRPATRDYLKTMHRVMREVGKAGKVAFQGGPSVEQQMGKKHGRRYTVGFNNKMWMSGKRAVAQAGVGKYQKSKFERKFAQLKIENKSRRRKFQPGRHGLKEEDVRGIAYQGWVEHLGKKKADMLAKSQGLDSPFHEYSRGREVRVEKGEERVMRTPSLSKEDRLIAREILRGAAPISYKDARLQQAEFTQEENVEVAEEIGKELGPKAQERYEKSWGVEMLDDQKDVASTRKAKEQTFAQGRGIGPGSVAQTRAAARAPSLRSDERQSPLSRLKSLISK